MGNVSSGVFRIIKKLVLIGLIIGVPMYFVRCASPSLFNIIKNRAIIVLDSTKLYSISKDVYLDGILRGQQDITLYTITRETPFYLSIVSKEKLEAIKPLGALRPNAVIEFGNVIRRGANVWAPAFFYLGEKPVHAYALFPREWEQNVKAFDKEKKITAINTDYEKFLKKNFQLMEVKPEGEKEYREKYNDYFMIRGMSGSNHFYAPKTDKAKIDKVYSYFLNKNSIDMVMLQADREWVRPALVLTPPEAEK